MAVAASRYGMREAGPDNGLFLSGWQGVGKMANVLCGAARNRNAERQ